MARVEKTVFISYRRTNISWALAIFQHLSSRGFDVFIDFEGIRSGDFEAAILENIRSRAHFLVILTPSALDECDEPGDWLRREVEEAMRCQRNIVPLFVDAFDIGAPSLAAKLQGDLANLKHYNGVRVFGEYFAAAMAKLEKFLDVALDAVRHPTSVAARRIAELQRAIAATAPRVEQTELSAQERFERAYIATDASEKLRLYGEAIHLKPDYAEAYNNRSIARFRIGDLDGAMEDLKFAIRLNPRYAAAYHNRGNIHLVKGNPQAALHDLDQAIQCRSNYAEAYYDRGNTNLVLRDFKNALRDLTEAIRLKPKEAEFYFSRGTVHYRAGDLESALQDLTEAIRLKPDFALAYDKRGVVRGTKGDLNGALQDADEAIRIDPNFVEALYNRSNTRRKLGDVEGANRDDADAARLESMQRQVTGRQQRMTRV